jgi:transketolase
MTAETVSFDAKPLRIVYGETLAELVREGLDLYVLEADLAAASQTDETFKKFFPERFLNIGVAEANMISLASGMAAMGKVTFASSFGPFVTRRVMDALFMAVSYSNLNIKVVGTAPGVDGRGNGASHQSFEDIALTRVLPNMTVIEPADARETRAAVRFAATHVGAVYIRLFREALPRLFTPDYHFRPGKASVMRAGGDVAIIASGYMTHAALAAADILAKKRLSARVINMSSIKPLDEGAVVAAARETGAIVTAENHSVIGGLGSAVCEVIAEQFPVPVRRVGMRDRVGEVGTLEYLCEHFGLTPGDIAREALSVFTLKTEKRAAA